MSQSNPLLPSNFLPRVIEDGRFYASDSLIGCETNDLPANPNPNPTKVK